LNANVAFLAIQSVDENTINSQRSPAQIASYLSVVMTIGSIILGLSLVQKVSIRFRESAQDVADFLNSWSSEKRGRGETRIGLETLAILCGVPFALLMWGWVFIREEL